MADVDIDQLPAGGLLQDTDTLIVQQGSTGSRRSVKLTADAIKAYVPQINQKYIWDTLGFVPASQDGKNVSGTWDIDISGVAASLNPSSAYTVGSITANSLTVTDAVFTGEVDLTQATALKFPQDTIAVKDTIRAENKVICEGQIETNTFKADGRADVDSLVSGSSVEGTRWQSRPTNEPAASSNPQMYYDVDLNCWRGYVKTATGGFWQDLSLRQIDDDPNNEVDNPYVGQQVINKYQRIWRYDGIQWEIISTPGK